MSSVLARQLADLQTAGHICPICDDLSGQIASTAAFIEDGLSRGERCIYLTASDETAQQVGGACADVGIDVVEECESGALQFVPKVDSYFGMGEFVPQRMIDYLVDMETDALAAGFSGLRVIGDMRWALGPERGCDRLIEYEILLDQLVERGHCLIICQYHRSSFDPTVIHDVFRTHPTVIVGDLVSPNPYYELPELFRSPAPRAGKEFKTRQIECWLARLEELRQAASQRTQLLERLQSLSARLIDVQESERSDFARELHDEIGPLLTGLRSLLKQLEEATQGNVKTNVAQARAVTDELLEAGRRMAFDLRPAALDLLGLLPALLMLFERYSEQTGVQVDFKYEDLRRRLSPRVETAASISEDFRGGISMCRDSLCCRKPESFADPGSKMLDEVVHD